MILLQVRRFVADGRNSRGNTHSVYGDPIPWPVEEVAPASSSDQPAPGHEDVTTVDLVVYAPPGPATPGHRDRVVVNAVEYEVDGEPGDWTLNPLDQPTAPHTGGGLVVKLTRTDG